MKVRELITMLQCLDQELDVQVSGDTIDVVKRDPEKTKIPLIVLSVDPATGDFSSNMMLGMYIAMAFSSQDLEESDEQRRCSDS